MGIATGSLGAAAPVAGPLAVQPQVSTSERVARAATRSAQAVKCGYNIDPARLKSGYLAYEGNQGASVEDMGKIAGVYDATVRVTLAEIRPNQDYCTEQRTAEIKADISRHLAGDYSVPVKASAQSKADPGGLFGWLSGGDQPAGREVYDPTWVNDIKNNPKTRRVE